MPGRQAAKYGQRPVFDYYDAQGNVTSTTWRQFEADIRDFAASLVAHGLTPGCKVAILSANAPHMLVTDFGCYAIGAVPVSIYSTASADQIKYIINDAKAQIIVTGDRRQYDQACNLAPVCPTLRLVVACHSEADGSAPRLSTVGRLATMTWADFMAEGAKATDDLRQRVTEYGNATADDTLATLIYTSGTTGEPKGAMLTHGNFAAAMAIHHQRLTMLSDADTSVSFLPMTHIFEKAWTYLCLDMGIHVSINADPHVIEKTLRAVHPTCMCSVPRFWEKVYAAVTEKMAAMNAMKRAFAMRALKVGARRNLHYKRQGLKVPALLEMQYRFFDKRVLGPVRRIIGVDNGNIFPTAGAPVSDTVVRFMHSMGINILVGYGLSETTATVTCYPTVDFVVGSVGTPMPEVQVRIGDNDEILVKGPTVMRGYYNKPDATAEAFTADGWFRTGDAGHFDDEGALVLTDRIKDLFKTSNGKYIAPQQLETRLAQDPFIDQVAIIGDERKYVSALIIPAFQALREYAHRKHIAFKTNVDLIRNADIRDLIQKRIDRLQKGLAGFEQIKKFTLLPREFTIESGELTNTLKLRRPIINRHYANQIEAMYT